MSASRTISRCAACGVERIGPGIGDWSGERTPCANDGCGSVALNVEVIRHDDASARDLLSAKWKDPSRGSRKGRTADVVTGSEYYRLDGVWHRVERALNYAEDLYDEVICDEVTGIVVHECHERLSEHAGHGSAARPRVVHDTQVDGTGASPK